VKRNFWIVALVVAVLAAVLLLGSAREPGGNGAGTTTRLWNLINRRTATWVGYTKKQITIRIVDEAAHPVSGALVQVYQFGEEGAKAQGRTGPDGEFVCTRTFMLCGEDRLFGSSGWILCEYDMLVVEIANYERVERELRDYAGRRWPSPGPPIPPIVVQLKRRNP
jgi:hypothetical protein